MAQVNFDAKSSLSPSRSFSSSSVPSFSDSYNKYTKQLLKGRHPRSFPRHSELWHYYDESTRRLENCLKGRDLWNVIDTEDDEHSHMTASVSDEPKERPLSTPINNQTGIYRGITVDLKGSLRMHYGMTIVVMNVLGQILSVKPYRDESGIESFEIQCKNPELLAVEDRFCFKLLDLAEPLNPGPVKYGAPLWLQLGDSSSGGGESSWLQGSVLGAQLFGPPEMKSIQLGQEEPPSPAIHSNKMDTNNSASASGPSLMRQRSGKLDAEERPGSRSPSKSRKNPKASGESTKKKLAEMANICGGMKVVKIADSTKHGSENPTTVKDEKKLRSKQAWQLGQFVAHFALRTPDTVDAGYVNSQSPLVLEQDLYCMATSTSQQSGYRPWPKKGKDIMREQREKEQLARSPSQTRPASDKNSNSLAVSQSGEEAMQTGGIDFACMRKFDIRGPPYDHIVDRRCVWRFCAVESSSDFKSMSVKEQRAQKLLKHAKVTLDNSKKNRTGGRQYKEVVVNGQPLVGGERFPRLLRECTAASTLKSETAQLQKRRMKEENLGSHFQTLFLRSLGTVSEFSDEELSLSGDDSSYASEMSTPVPGAEDSRHLTGVGRSVSFKRHSSGGVHITGGSPSYSSGTMSPDSKLGAGAGFGKLLGSPSSHSHQSNHSGRSKSGHSHRHHPHGHGRRGSPDSRGSGTGGKDDDEGLNAHETPPDRGRHSYGDELLAIHKGFAETNMYTRSLLTSNRQRTDTTPTRGQDVPSVSAKITLRMDTLMAMDDLMQQALKHRSRIDKRRTNIREDSSMGEDTLSMSQQTE